MGGAREYQDARAPAFRELEADLVFAREAIVLGECDRYAGVGREAHRLELALKLAVAC